MGEGGGGTVVEGQDPVRIQRRLAGKPDGNALGHLRRVVDRAGQPGYLRGKRVRDLRDGVPRRRHIGESALGRVEVGLLPRRERAIAKSLQNGIPEGIHAEGRVGARKGQEPVLPAGRGAAELDQGPVRGHAHLLGVALTEGRIGIEGLVGIVGPGFGRQDVDDDVGVRCFAEDDTPAVADQLAEVVKEAGVIRIACILRFDRKPGADVVLAVEQRDGRWLPGIESSGRYRQIERLAPRVVIDDLTGLACTLPLDDLEGLAGEIERRLVGRVTRHRDDEFVVDAPQDPGQVYLREELVVGQYRRDTHEEFRC